MIIFWRSSSDHTTADADQGCESQLVHMINTWKANGDLAAGKCSTAEVTAALLASVFRLASKKLILPTVIGTSGLTTSPVHKERKVRDTSPQRGSSLAKCLVLLSSCALGYL